jgi:hypothetical protein
MSLGNTAHRVPTVAWWIMTLKCMMVTLHWKTLLTPRNWLDSCLAVIMSCLRAKSVFSLPNGSCLNAPEIRQTGVTNDTVRSTRILTNFSYACDKMLPSLRKNIPEVRRFSDRAILEWEFYGFSGGSTKGKYYLLTYLLHGAQSILRS